MQAYIYILTNKPHGSLYIGVTSNLIKRIYQHKEKLADGHTKRYNITTLVYYEIADNIESAITREKQLKAGSRNRKLKLINAFNPSWKDLCWDLF